MAIESGITAIPIRIEEPSGDSHGLTGWLVSANINLNIGSTPNEATVSFANEDGEYTLTDSALNTKITLNFGSGTFVGYVKNVEIDDSEGGRIARVVLQDERSHLSNYRISTATNDISESGFLFDQAIDLDSAPSIGAFPSLKMPRVNYATVQDANLISVLPSYPDSYPAGAGNRFEQQTLKEIDTVLAHGATYGQIYNAINDSTKSYYAQLSGTLPTPAEVAKVMRIDQLTDTMDEIDLDISAQTTAIMGFIDGSGDNKIRHQFDPEVYLDEALDQVYNDLGVDWYWDGTTRKIKLIPRDTSLSLSAATLPGIFGKVRIRTNIGKAATEETRVAIIMGARRTGLLGNPLALTNQIGNWKLFTIGPNDLEIRGAFSDPLRSPGDKTFSLSNTNAVPYWHYVKVRYYLPGTGEKYQTLSGTSFLRDFLLRPVFPVQGVPNSKVNNINTTETSLISYDRTTNYFDLPENKIRLTNITGKLPSTDPFRKFIEEASGWAGGASGAYWEYYPSDMELSAALDSKASWQFVVAARLPVTGVAVGGVPTSIVSLSVGDSALSGLIISELPTFKLGTATAFKDVKSFANRVIKESGEYILLQDANGNNQDKVPIWHGCSAAETIRKSIEPGPIDGNYFKSVDVTERVPLSNLVSNFNPQDVDTYLGSRPGSDAIFGRYIPVPTIKMTGHRLLTADQPVVDVELAHDGAGVLVLAQNGEITAISTTMPQFTYPNNGTLPPQELFTGNITGYYEQTFLYQAFTRTNEDGTTQTGYVFGPQFNEKAKRIKRQMQTADENEDGYYVVYESGSVFGFGGARNFGSFNQYVFENNSEITEINPDTKLQAVSIAPLFAKVTKMGLPLFATGDGYAVIFSNGKIYSTGACTFGLTGVGTVFDKASTIMENAVGTHSEKIIEIAPSLNSKITSWLTGSSSNLETYVFSFWWDQNPSTAKRGGKSLQIAGLEAGTKDRGLELNIDPDIGTRLSAGLERQVTRLKPIELDLQVLGGANTTYIKGIPYQHFDPTTGAFPFDQTKYETWKCQVIPVTNVGGAKRVTAQDNQDGPMEITSEPFAFECVVTQDPKYRFHGEHIFAIHPDWCTTTTVSDSYWTCGGSFGEGDSIFYGALHDDLVLFTRDKTKSPGDDNYNVVLTDFHTYNPGVYTASGDYGFYVLSTSGGLPIVRGFGTAFRMVDQHEGTGITGQFLKAIYADTTEDSAPLQSKTTSLLKVGDSATLIAEFQNGTRAIADMALPFFSTNLRPILPGPATLVSENQYDVPRATEAGSIMTSATLNISSIYVDSSALCNLCIKDVTDFPKSGLITVITTDVENERPWANRRLMTLGYSGVVTATTGPEFTSRLILSTETDVANKHPGFPSGYYTGVPVDIQDAYSKEYLLEHAILQGHGKMPDPVNDLIPEAFPITNSLVVDFVGGSGNVGTSATGIPKTNAVQFFSGNEVVVNWQKSISTESVEASGVWLIDNSGRIYTVPTFENYHNVKLIDPTMGGYYVNTAGQITGEASAKFDALIPSHLFDSVYDYKGDTEVSRKEAFILAKSILTRNTPIAIDYSLWQNFNLSKVDYELKIFWDEVKAESVNIPVILQDLDITTNWSQSITRAQAEEFINWLHTADCGTSITNPFTTNSSYADVDNVPLSTNPTDAIIREDFQCAILWNLENSDPNSKNADFVVEFSTINKTPLWDDFTTSSTILNGVDGDGVITDAIARRRYLTAQMMNFRNYWSKPTDQYGVYNTTEINFDDSITLFGAGQYSDTTAISNVAGFRPSSATTSGIVHELVALTSTKYSGLPLFGHEHEHSVFDPAGMAELAAGPKCDLMREYLDGQQVVALTPTFGGTNIQANKFDEFGRLVITSSGHILFTNKGEGYRTILPMDVNGTPLSSSLGLSGIYVQNSGNVFILASNTPEVGQYTSVDIQDLNSLLDVDINAFLYPETLERASFVDEWYRNVKSLADQYYAKSYVVPRGLFQSGQRFKLAQAAFVDLDIEGELIPDYFRTVGVGPTLNTTKQAAAAPFVSMENSMISPHAVLNRAGGVRYGVTTNETPSDWGTFYDGLTFDVVPINTSEVGGMAVNSLDQNAQSIIISSVENGEIWDPGTIKIDFGKPHFDAEAEFFMYNRMLYASKTGWAIVSGVDMRSVVWPDGVEIDITGVQIVPPTGFSNAGTMQFESLGLLKVPIPPSSIYFGIPVIEQFRYGPFIAGETGLLTGGTTAKGQVYREVDDTISPENFPVDEGGYNRVQKSRFVKMVRHGIAKARGKVSTLASNDTAEVEVWGLPEVTFDDFYTHRIDNVGIQIDSEGTRTTYSMRSKDKIFAKDTTRLEKRQKEMIAQINQLRQIYNHNVVKQFAVQIGESTRQNYGKLSNVLGARPTTSYELDSDTIHEISTKL